MNLSKKLAVIVTLVFIAAACNTGKKALQRGDYYEATIQAVKNLRSNPDSKKSKETIEQSYPMALDYYRQKIDEISISNNSDKYLSIVDIYTKLNSLADEISRCPAALEIVKPVVYFHEQLAKAKDMAITEQYQAGLQLLKTGLINDARTACEKFEWVSQNRPGYADVDNKIAEALELGTIKVVIERIPYMGDVYEANLKRFYDKIYLDVAKNNKNRFVRFYQSQEAEESRIVPNQVVTMQFVDFSVGNIYEKETEKNYVSDTLVIGSYKDDKGISHDVKGTVKAKANIHERSVLSKGILMVKIIDYESNTALENKRYPGEYVWHNNWANFNGDERALPDDVKKMTKAKQLMPPLPQDLFVLFSDPLGSNASTMIKSYYRKR